jgi:hypothetical protein
MVGQRVFSSKTRPSLALEVVVPKNNFYRRVKQILNRSGSILQTAAGRSF